MEGVEARLAHARGRFLSGAVVGGAGLLLWGLREILGPLATDCWPGHGPEGAPYESWPKIFACSVGLAAVSNLLDGTAAAFAGQAGGGPQLCA